METTFLDVMEKIRDLPEKHYRLILKVLERRNMYSGESLSGSDLMDVIDTPVAELEKELESYSPEGMIRSAVFEAVKRGLKKSH